MIIGNYFSLSMITAKWCSLSSKKSGRARDGPTKRAGSGSQRRRIPSLSPSAQMSAMVASPEMRTSAQANAAMLLDVACCNRSGTLRPLADSHGTNWARGRAVPAMQRSR